LNDFRLCHHISIFWLTIPRFISPHIKKTIFDEGTKLSFHTSRYRSHLTKNTKHKIFLAGIKVRKTNRTKNEERLHAVKWTLFTYSYWYYMTINDRSIEMHLSGDGIVSYMNCLNLHTTYLIHFVHYIYRHFIPLVQSVFLRESCLSCLLFNHETWWWWQSAEEFL